MEIEICPICWREYSESNKPVKYHIQYYPVRKYVYACNSCNYHEYLSRHPNKNLTKWDWYKIWLTRRYGNNGKKLLGKQSKSS